MIIQKRTLNWLPRPSLFQEAEAARLKRKQNSQNVMNSNANLNATLIGNNTAVSGEAVNLTLRIAAARIQTGVKPKV